MTSLVQSLLAQKVNDENPLRNHQDQEDIESKSQPIEQETSLRYRYSPCETKKDQGMEMERRQRNSQDQWKEDESFIKENSLDGHSSYNEFSSKTKQTNEQIDRNFEEINQMIGEMICVRNQQAGTSMGLDLPPEPPFTKEVMAVLLPPKSKMPQLEPYDGTSDPVDHLKSFKSLILLHGTLGAVLCRGFPATLKKAACT